MSAYLWLLQHLALNFADQEGEVGVSEAEIRRGDAIVFDVGRHMLVVWMRAGQRWIVWVRGGVVPVELLLTLPHFIRIGHDPLAGKIKTLIHPHHNILVELDVAFHNANRGSTRVNAYGMPSYGRGGVQQRIDDLAV